MREVNHMMDMLVALLIGLALAHSYYQAHPPVMDVKPAVEEKRWDAARGMPAQKASEEPERIARSDAHSVPSHYYLETTPDIAIVTMTADTSRITECSFTGDTTLTPGVYLSGR